MERSFIMIKPDGVERGLIGPIVERFTRRGFRLVAAKTLRIKPELSRQHYAEHAAKPFYPELEGFITRGPVFAMVWEGDQVINVARAMMGPTNSAEAPSGTIRGDYSVSKSTNIIHGSDSAASATREIALFFKPEELL